MFTTPPATLLMTGLITGPVTGPSTGRTRSVPRAARGIAGGDRGGRGGPAGRLRLGEHASGGHRPGGGAATSGGRTATPAGTAAGSGASNGSASSGTAGLALCQPSSLQVTVNASQAGGAAGSTYVPVDFINTSGTPCGLYGYPGMSFVTAGDGSGSQIGAPAQENPSFGKVPVQLAAGGAAHAWLQVAEAGNYPAAAVPAGEARTGCGCTPRARRRRCT